MQWNGRTIVDISREFLNSNGAEKHIDITAAAPKTKKQALPRRFTDAMLYTASDLSTCSRRGLSERFDSTIGAGTVLMPFGGKHQLTPIQAMVQKISMEIKHTDDCSFMSWGYDPEVSSNSPYHGAYLAVVESVSKLIATGASFEDVYLTFQEYFEKPGTDGKRWGKPLSALLGAFKAQMDLGIGAIGGKDSMSGSFEKLDVPPTLVSFAVTTEKQQNIVSPELKAAGHYLMRLAPEYDENGLPKTASLLAVYDQVTRLIRNGTAVSCWTLQSGGILEGVMKMAFGNGFGFRFNPEADLSALTGKNYGAFLLEVPESTNIGTETGFVTNDGYFTYGTEKLELSRVLTAYEGRLEGVYSCNIPDAPGRTENFTYDTKRQASPAVKIAKPRVLIPAFPGTNCETDSAKAIRDAGLDPEIIVIKNRTAADIQEAVAYFAKRLNEAQIVFIPGGFSGGDEPDGSGKFITAFFRNAAIKEGVTTLLENRDGLMAGICNGFQALIKLGLLPEGRIRDVDEMSPTLTFNTISRHQSKLVRTRIASNKSPWLMLTEPGEIYTVPISHGEGRFYADEALIRMLAKNGQIATQYVDLSGNATMDVRYNPNGSMYSIEGITSPDGRVFGKMGHSERIGDGLYRNVEGNYDIRMFNAAKLYFR